MIDHNRKIIYLHINKCGGKSIENALWNHIGTSDHRIPEDYIKEIGAQKYNSYFKFGFVRNTWDRFVSMYHGRRERGNLKNTEISFEAFIKSLPDSEQRLSDSRHLLFYSQLRWVLYEGTPIDFIGRFENYQAEWEKICEKLGETIKVPHLNKSKHESYTKYYTPDLRNLIRAKYKEEIEYFDFKF